MGLSKKALYFSTDAVLAAMLLLGGFLFVYELTVTETSLTNIDYLSKDLLTALDAIPIGELNHPFIQQEIVNGNITNTQNSILEQLAEYWAKGEDAKAQQLANITINGVLPTTVGMKLQFTPDLLYEQLKTGNNSIVASRRMVSGLEKGKPLQGSSSYGYLRNIKDKKSSAYAYYGGFVGQGNVTTQLERLPDDVNTSRIKAITFEADLQRDFTIFINNDECANLTPSLGNYSADNWNLTNCSSSLVPGINNITITFDSLNDAYIGGGYLRVDYETDEFQTNKSYELTTYNFPRISGIVNLYDAFHVPGDMQEVLVYLHYHANHTNSSIPFYLTIADETIYTDTNSTNEVMITLSNAQLSAILNYTQLSNSTIPLRLGFENLTYNTFYTGNADVALVTDVSGSMDWNFTHDSSSSTQRNCDNALINDLSTQRLSVAKCLDKDFASSILNVSGNYISLVSYDSSTDSTLDLGTNITSIYNEIGMGTGAPAGYTAGGSTCICCGINSAYDQLSAGVTPITLIAQNTEWNYTNNYFSGNIPNDALNRTWYNPNYALEATWGTGPAVLGHDAGFGGTVVDTELGSSLESTQSQLGNGLVVDLWDMVADNITPEVDFASGINETANTWGRGAGDDGWDRGNGTYGYGTGMAHQYVNNMLRLATPTSSDSSAAWGIEFTITPEQYAIISSPSGRAELSFDYWWEHVNTEFESSDQVWVKGIFHSASASTYLGSNLDGSHTGGDATAEIDAEDNPNSDITGATFTQNLKSLISGSGTYYLELGGKLDRSWTNEYGYFSFDNILLVARNDTAMQSVHYPDLWELVVDRGSRQVDFSSGVNQSGNTWGQAAANDGWDWSSGTFTYGSAMEWYGVSNQRLMMRAPDYNSNDVSGSFGVTVNITPEQYAVINASGTALLSFNYWWDDYQNYYEDNDQVWIKGRWHSATTSTWLGSDLDDDHNNGDGTPEINAQDNPNVDMVNEYYSVDLAPYINSSGLYYLELGGKLQRSTSSEWGDFYFDNILIEIRNSTDHYYFRRHFTISDLADVKRGFVNLLADDYAAIFVNGNFIEKDTRTQEGTYWDKPGVNIPGKYFTLGDNVIAIELHNDAQSAKFDLELIGVNDSQQKAMMVMTDGVANDGCARQGITGDLDGDGNSNTDSDDAIQAACDAAEDYGITTYAVGFSDTADEATLRGIAECGNGLYQKSYNTSELQVFYQDVVLNILEVSRQSQSIVVSSGTPTNSVIYEDSYIRVNHTSLFKPPGPNEIELDFQTAQFKNCTTTFTIPVGLRVSDAKLTSYSADHWSSKVQVDGQTAFNLSRFALNYSRLGDPFLINIPVPMLTPGTHNLSFSIADDEYNNTGCSQNNSMIYTAFVNSSTTRSGVVDKAEGCNWTVEFEDTSIQNFNVPDTYVGAKTCSYTNTSLVYDNQDAYDIAVYSLLSNLDFDNDHRVFVNLAAEDLEIIVSLVSQVPYLWGPAIMEIQIWQ